MIQNVFQK